MSRDDSATVEQRFQHGVINAAGPAATELASYSPGTSGEEVIAEARRVAEETAAPLIDVVQAWLTGAYHDMPLEKISDPVDGPGRDPLFDARGPGDLFFADAATVDINHGHNGIYVSNSDTVEALDPERDVVLVDNTTAGDGTPGDNSRRKVHNPSQMWVNTSGDVRTRAVNFARAQVGKEYLSKFWSNKRWIEGVAYNCSSLVWAAYMHASGGAIDLDDAAGGEEEHTGAAIWPREIPRSKWITPYP